MKNPIKLNNKIFLFIAGLILGADIYVTGFYDKSLILDDPYGLKWILGLLVTLIILSVGVGYYFSNVEKISTLKKLLSEILIANVLSLAISRLLIALAQRLVETDIFLDFIGGRYLVYFVAITLTSLIFAIKFYNRAKLVETKLSNRFVDIVNFVVPGISFMLIGFFLPEFRAMLAVLVVVFLVTLIAGNLAKGIFRNDS